MIKWNMYFLCLIISISFESYAGVILLDPGHGGDDQGAQKIINGKIYKEKDLTLKLALEIRKVLINQGHTIYLTRSKDQTMSLTKRSKLADKINADIVLSIHLNSTKNSKTQGLEIYYLDGMKGKVLGRYNEKDFKVSNSTDPLINTIVNQVMIKKCTDQSKQLAEKIHKNLLQKHIKHHNIKDRGVRPGVFYVLTFSKRPAILLEAGFMSSAQELRKILSKSFQVSLANSIAQGVSDFFHRKI